MSIIFIRVCGANFLGMVWGHPTPHVPLDLIPPIWRNRAGMLKILQNFRDFDQIGEFFISRPLVHKIGDINPKGTGGVIKLTCFLEDLTPIPKNR